MNDLVVCEADADGLGSMIAELVRGNLDTHPERAGLLRGVSGRVNIVAVDAGAGAGLIFTGHGLRVGRPHPKPDIAVSGTAETLLSLSNIPLRFGNPDITTPEGRAVLAKMRRGELKIRGMLKRPKLMARLQRLLSVL